jgi:predicted transcriptional regulator
VSTQTIAQRPVPAALDHSLARRLDALERANIVRERRANLKHDLKARRVDPCNVLFDPPQYAEGMRVVDVLLALPKYGRTKVNKMLAECGCAARGTIIDLDDTQREMLVWFLRRGGPAAKPTPVPSRGA